MPDYVSHEKVDAFIGLYHNNAFQFSITESSTAASCVYVMPDRVPPGGYDAFTIHVQNDQQLAAELHSYIDQGYSFSFGSVRVTCSIYQFRLREAKQILIERLLLQSPTPFDVQKAVSESGIALNYQVDKNPAIFNDTTVKDDIHDKLRRLQLETENPKLYAKYKSLNRYYNATKHAKTAANQSDAEQLVGPLGKEIAIDYFETVIRLFKWYYAKYADGVPTWDELKPVDYPSYGSVYAYSYERLWP